MDWYCDKDCLLINDDFFNPFWKDILLQMQVDCILSDPPFNIADRGKVTKAHGKIYSNKEAWGSVFKDEFTPKEYDIFITDFLMQSFDVLKPGGALLVFIDRKYAGRFIQIAEGCQFIYKNIITFVKRNCVPKIRAFNYASATEVAVWMHKPRGKGQGTKTKPNVFNYQKPPKGCRHSDGELWLEKYHNEYSSNVYFYNVGGKKMLGHPCEKYPDQLYPLIETHTNPGDIILDPFAGSYKIGFCATSRGRNYIGFDLDKKYFDQMSNIMNMRHGVGQVIKEVIKNGTV